MFICNVEIKNSSFQHLQADGAFEVMNRVDENYLLSFCDHQQNDWDVYYPSQDLRTIPVCRKILEFFLLRQT